MREEVRVYISEEELEAKIQEMADSINEKYAGKSVHLIGILKGSVIFMSELAKRITLPLTMDFMECSSYGSGTVSKGTVRFVKDLDEPIEGREVILVEDIVDSGNTLYYLTDQLLLRKPASFSIYTLLDKPSRRVKDVKNIQSCFEIEDYFVVGYGLDYDQKYRNLPYVGIVDFIED